MGNHRPGSRWGSIFAVSAGLQLLRAPGRVAHLRGPGRDVVYEWARLSAVRLVAQSRWYFPQVRSLATRDFAIGVILSSRIDCVC